MSCAAQKDEVYLNLVLDFVPETVYRVARHFNKAKSIIPIIYVKVFLLPFLHNVFLNTSQEASQQRQLFGTLMQSLCYHIDLMLCGSTLGVHVPVVSQSGLHPFPGRVSQRHQAPKPAGGP